MKKGLEGFPSKPLIFIGGAGGNRPHDLLNANQGHHAYLFRIFIFLSTEHISGQYWNTTSGFRAD